MRKVRHNMVPLMDSFIHNCKKKKKIKVLLFLVTIVNITFDSNISHLVCHMLHGEAGPGGGLV